MNILMVCLGNICRSPLAAGILEDKAKSAGLQWQVDSAGTNAYDPGCSPHHLSQKVAMHFGVNISEQKCRQFTKDDIDYFDKIYVMDKKNYHDVQQICGKKWNTEKVDFLLNEIYPGQNKIVPDPWFGDEEDFYNVYKMIDEACEAVVKKYALVPNNNDRVIN